MAFSSLIFLVKHADKLGVKGLCGPGFFSAFVVQWWVFRYYALRIGAMAWHFFKNATPKRSGADKFCA